MDKAQDDVVSYTLSIHYDSKYGHHSDHLYVEKDNLTAVIDTLPAALIKDLHAAVQTDSGEAVRTYDYVKGKLFNNDNQAQTILITQESFNRNPGHNISIEPRVGRFYPVLLFNSDKLQSRNRMTPLRVIDIKQHDLVVNTSHALSDYDTSLTFAAHYLPADRQCDSVHSLQAKHIPDLLTGPGMQLRYADKATDFFSDEPYLRSDENDDGEFYIQPRHINHLDETALMQLKNLYNELVPEKSEVLDLMSSINSHLDDKLMLKKVTGLGMNKEEMQANPRLDEIVVHDINKHQRLPFADASFDCVVCSLSIEYLTRPAALFAEVARIIRPGGRFIISFSNRWFPGKAVQVWNNLHDFERIGLVMEYFIESASFGNIDTCSHRGMPRPISDKHNIPLSDPIYAVWANRI